MQAAGQSGLRSAVPYSARPCRREHSAAEVRGACPHECYRRILPRVQSESLYADERVFADERLCGHAQSWVTFMAAMKFDPGQIVATRGAVEAFVASGDSPYGYLLRHVEGDWGEIDPDDVIVNELSLQRGFRLLSSYRLSSGVTVWCITEADRSVTTFLLPEEY